MKKEKADGEDKKKDSESLQGTFPSPPRTYYFGTGALKGPLRTYYLGTWGARVCRVGGLGPL